MKRLVGCIVFLVVVIGGGLYFTTTGAGEYAVGYLYYINLNNPVIATSWFQKAAIQGYAPEESWVLQAAAAGYAPAEYILGLAEYQEGDAYYLGQGVAQDANKSKAAYSLAVTSWIQKAANEEYQPAADLLAVAYVNGDGVPQDIQKAMSLLKASANTGYAPSEFYYGIRLALTGDAKATYWIQRAKAQGYLTEIPY